MASAKNIVNRINGTIAPLAAAAIGFDGINDISQAENVCAGSAASWPAASAAPAGSGGGALGGESNSKTAGATGMTTIAIPVSSSRKTSSVRPPSRPTALTSVADATPVMSSDTTSGMTVMRMALTQSVPTGAMR